MSKAAETIREYAGIFAKGDVDALAALYAAKTDYQQPFAPLPLTTPAEVRAFEAAMFAGFSNISVDIDWLVADGDEGAAGARNRATHTGPMPQPDGGELAATHRTIDLLTAEHLRVDAAGRIVEHRRYMDGAGFMAQLGLLGD